MDEFQRRRGLRFALRVIDHTAVWFRKDNSTYGPTRNWQALWTAAEMAEQGGRRPQAERAASAVLRNAGFGANVLHRTGHSLGESVHGNGVNMDDYETHDDRRLLAGTGFTIEPGLYFDDFGVRSEINMLVRDRDAIVTGPVQTEIVTLGKR